jgi:hypothetical protein
VGKIVPALNAPTLYPLGLVADALLQQGKALGSEERKGLRSELYFMLLMIGI